LVPFCFKGSDISEKVSEARKAFHHCNNSRHSPEAFSQQSFGLAYPHIHRINSPQQRSVSMKRKRDERIEGLLSEYEVKKKNPSFNIRLDDFLISEGIEDPDEAISVYWIRKVKKALNIKEGDESFFNQ